MTAPVNVNTDVVQQASPDPQPMPTAHVNLLPVEIIVRRRVRAVQRRLVGLLVLVVVICLGANVYYRLDESRASSSLDAQLGTVTTLQQAQVTYAEVPRIQSEVTAIDTSLATLMANDMRWDLQLAALQADPGSGIIVTGITAGVNDAIATAPDATTTGPGALDPSGTAHLGTLTVTGEAPTHQAVADWVDALATVDGFLVPYIRGSAVADEVGGAVDFTVEITLSSELRSERYRTETPAPDSPGAAAPIDGG